MKNAELENSQIFIILPKLKILDTIDKIDEIKKLPNYKMGIAKNTAKINTEYINWRKIKIPNYNCSNFYITKIQIYRTLNFRIVQLTNQ